MSNTPPSNNLEVIDVALEATGTAIALVESVSSKYRSLADQLIRSAASVPANLAEGRGRNGRDRTHHFRIALGSAREVDVHLRILVGIGIVDRHKAAAAIELFDRVRAMTWRLMHPKR